MKVLLNKKSFIAVIASLVISIIMVQMIFINYSDFSKTLISNEQKRLLAVADAIAKSIEEYVDSNQRSLEIIAKDKRFINNLEALFNSRENDVYDILEVFIDVNASRISRIKVYDVNGELKVRYPYDKEDSLTTKAQEEIEQVINTEQILVGEVVFPNKGIPYVDIILPVHKGDYVYAVINAQVEIDVIYNEIVKPVEIGTTGYASVKTDDTRLLMHPSSNDIGLPLMKVRRERYPDYDWSELEQVVKDQLINKRGVSIYHSVWAGDVSGTRVKKFSAYSSAYIGEHFWIVTISADYNEVVAVIRKNYYLTIITSFMIFLVLIIAAVYLLGTIQKEKELKERLSHLKEVERLNEELEEDIKQKKILQNELIKSNDKYHAIFNSNKDCVILMKYEDEFVGEMIEANKKTLDTFEYDKNELLNMKISELHIDQTNDELNERLAALITDNAALYEANIKSKSGKVIPMEFNASVFELDGKKRILLIARDITLRKQEEQILIRSERRFIKIVNELATEMQGHRFDVDTFHSQPNALINQKLEEINIQLEKLFKNEMDENRKRKSLLLMQSENAAMGEMIGNIAHQWRQPLNTLSLIIINIQDDILNHNIPKEDQEILQKMFDKGGRIIRKMSETIDDFRYFFKPQYSKEYFNIGDTINGTIHMFDERLKLYGIGLDVVGAEKLEIYGYSNHLSQVVLNIINNAVDEIVNKPEIRAPYIKILFEKNNNQYEIRIIDNAGGVNEDIIDNIFDSYFTTKQSKKGTGLGLYMSKIIIESTFNGTLEVFNEKEGACFIVKIPEKEAD